MLASAQGRLEGDVGVRSIDCEASHSAMSTKSVFSVAEAYLLLSCFVQGNGSKLAIIWSVADGWLT